MQESFIIRPDLILDIETLEAIIKKDKVVILSDASKGRIINCRTYLEKEILEAKKTVYGINTGFGSLCNRVISEDKLGELQVNLVRSHACGTGATVSEEISKRMLLHKIISLSAGYSGVSLELVERLLAMFNKGYFPVIYEMGSLGASGDLAPLAHMALPLLGEGEVSKDGEIISGGEMLRSLGWEPLELVAKEGLAILNGTQFMSSFGTLVIHRALRLFDWSNIIGAISLDGFDGIIEAFDPLIHQIRNQKGQILAAAEILKYLKGSEIASKNKPYVQDPYSFRCMPQVHGASYDVFQYAKGIFDAEINGVTDNPNLFAEEKKVLMGGNFHGQPLAMTLDFISIAIAELGSISERRVFQLLGGYRGLPDFLIDDPGLHSGLMIPQYVAASLVSQNKQLCTPASVDSITSSNGQEDHVSMGANAATKALKVLQNAERILAIEMINASQAIYFRKDQKSSPFIENLLKEYRKHVPIVSKDRYLHKDIEKSLNFILNHEF